MNYFFKPKYYPFMRGSSQIGIFKIDMNSTGDYIYSLELFKPIISNNLVPWEFTCLENGGFISETRDKEWHRRMIKSWIMDRIMPIERQNKDRILDRLGLAEYDELSLLKKTKARSFHDNLWIDFNRESGERDVV